MSDHHASLPTVPPGSKDALPRLGAVEPPTVPDQNNFPPTLQGACAVGEPPVGTIQKVGDYKVLGKLGSGGMGVVYKAFDQKLGRIVALKMLHIGRDASAEEILRFRSEAEMLGRLQHPNIVQIFDFGVHEGAPYLVMEFVNGGSLDKKLQGTPQPPRRAAEWIEQLARAVHSAHESKVIHRDLKPANVLVTAEGALKITDFGLAKQMELSHGLTQTGAVMGTPSYMAPEQAEGKKDVGPPADVYSLGAILYECLTGRPPFRGATLQETLEQVCHADPAPPSRLVPRLPRDLQTVCLKCLHKSPRGRYCSALELADDLANWLDGLPVKARPAHSVERLIRIVARRPLRATLAAAGAVVVGLAVVLGVVVRDQKQERELNRQRDAARVAEAEQQREKEAREDQAELHEAALRNLRIILGLTMRGDLNTVEGLDRLEDNLGQHAEEALNHPDVLPERQLVLSSAFHQLAGLYCRLGQSEKAVKTLDLAEKLGQCVLARDPADGKAQSQMARVLLLRGTVNVDRQEWRTAEADLEGALRLLDRLDGQASDRQEHARLRAATLHTLGTEAARDRARHEAALAYYKQALAIRRLLAAAEKAPGADHTDLARSLGYLGDLYLSMNELRQADAAYWESHLMREAMAMGAPRDPETQFQFGRSWENFGRYQTLRRAPTTARFFLNKAEDVLRRLALRRPDNKEYVLELAFVRNRIAELCLLAGDTPSAGALKDAASTCELNESMLQDLRTDHPGDNTAKCLLAECYALKGRLLLAGPTTERAGLAGESLRKARSLLEAVLVSRGRLSPDERYVLAAAEALAAEVSEAAQTRPVKGDSRTAEKAKADLLEAIEKGFRRLHPDDVADDRAFRRVRKEQWFLQALRSMREDLPALPTPAKSPPAEKTPAG